MQKENVVVVFADGDVHGEHARNAAFQCGQLVVVSGKEGAQVAASPLCKVFHHGPGQGHAVIGAGAPANFVQNHKAAAGGLTQNAGRFHHFHHKGALTLRKVV